MKRLALYIVGAVSHLADLFRRGFWIIFFYYVYFHFRTFCSVVDHFQCVRTYYKHETNGAEMEAGSMKIVLLKWERD